MFLLFSDRLLSRSTETNDEKTVGKDGLEQQGEYMIVSGMSAEPWESTRSGSLDETGTLFGQ